MSKDPAFLFYSSDFITGVQTMPFEDRGKYITILAQMHQQGRMDEETIRFLVGSVSDKLRAKFKTDEKGFWYNERLELETARRNLYTESRRINGNLGGRPKKSKPNAKPKQNHKDKHMANHMEDVNINEDINEDNKGASKKIEIMMPFDNPLFAQAWANWKQYRKESGKPYRSAMSEQAGLKMLSKYSCGEAMQMIEQSIANGWQGLFETKNKTNGNKASNNAAKQSLIDSIRDLNSR